MHIEHFGCFIQVDLFRRGTLYEVDESFRELSQTIIYSVLLDGHYVIPGNVGVSDTPPSSSLNEHILAVRAVDSPWTQVLEDAVRKAANRH